MSDFEIEVTIVMGARQPVFFDRENFDDVIKGVAPRDSDRTAHAGESAPTASKDLPDDQQKVLDIYRQLWPDGYKGRAKKRDQAIMSEFQQRHKDQVSARTIQRALKSLKSV
jgi:hypothetical protein